MGVSTAGMYGVGLSWATTGLYRRKVYGRPTVGYRGSLLRVGTWAGLSWATSGRYVGRPTAGRYVVSLSWATAGLYRGRCLADPSTTTTGP